MSEQQRFGRRDDESTVGTFGAARRRLAALSARRAIAGIRTEQPIETILRHLTGTMTRDELLGVLADRQTSRSPSEHHEGDAAAAADDPGEDHWARAVEQRGGPRRLVRC